MATFSNADRVAAFKAVQLFLFFTQNPAANRLLWSIANGEVVSRDQLGDDVRHVQFILDWFLCPRAPARTRHGHGHRRTKPCEECAAKRVKCEPNQTQSPNSRFSCKRCQERGLVCAPKGSTPTISHVQGPTNAALPTPQALGNLMHPEYTSIAQSNNCYVPYPPMNGDTVSTGTRALELDARYSAPHNQQNYQANTHRLVHSNQATTAYHDYGTHAGTDGFYRDTQDTRMGFPGYIPPDTSSAEPGPSNWSTRA